jgi:prepilin-type N-terminal cleavage/methylation domain-containing protein
MLNKLRKRTEGFTIIEVLIVLAIAGLILLIVFLAVPALQRNSRNTQRKNDASAMAGAIANYISNNGGKLPTEAHDDGNGNVEFCDNAGCATGNKEVAKLGYYEPSAVTVVADQDEASVGTLDKDTVKVDTKRACNDDNTGVSATSSARTAAVRYAVESSSSATAQQCVEQ